VGIYNKSHFKIAKNLSLILKEKSWAFKQQSQSYFKRKNRGHLNNNLSQLLKEKTWAFQQQSLSTFKRKNVGISTTISVNF
jgi:hypothetical protein